MDVSLPILRLQEAILDLLRDVPAYTLLSADTSQASGLPDSANHTLIVQLCDLIQHSGSAGIQTSAYRILNKVIKQNTLGLVLEVEASIDEAEEGHATRSIQLPHSIMDLVQDRIDWQEASIETTMCRLLAWMAILDHFEDAVSAFMLACAVTNAKSRTLRWAYQDQLNSSKLIHDDLLPMLFEMLEVSEVGSTTFKASAFEVDQYFTDRM